MKLRSWKKTYKPKYWIASDIASSADGFVNVTQLPRDFWARLMSVWLEKEDTARLDMAMSERRGRRALLEGLRSGLVCYEGSQGEKDQLSFLFLRWVKVRGVSLRALSPCHCVPSCLVYSVAMNSPDLKYLHMNYSLDNQQYLEQIETRCHKIREVGLRDTNLVAKLTGGNLVLDLVTQDRLSVFCETPRLKESDWHRESPRDEKMFSWKRFLYSGALIEAAWTGDTPIAISCLQEDSCNVDATTAWGCTPLMLASQNGYTEIVKRILQKGTNSIDWQDLDQKDTALMVACHEGHPSVVELLIRRGANLDLKDKNEETAFDLLDHDCNGLSKEVKTRLKDLPRLLKQEQLKK